MCGDVFRARADLQRSTIKTATIGPTHSKTLPQFTKTSITAFKSHIIEQLCGEACEQFDSFCHFKYTKASFVGGKIVVENILLN